MCSICKKYPNQTLTQEERKAMLVDIGKAMAKGSSTHLDSLIDRATGIEEKPRNAAAEAVYERSRR